MGGGGGNSILLLYDRRESRLVLRCVTSERVGLENGKIGAA